MESKGLTSLYLGVGDVDLEDRASAAERTKADDAATSQRDGRVVEHTVVDVRVELSTEISQDEATPVTVVLDDRMPVINRLALYVTVYR